MLLSGLVDSDRGLSCRAHVLEKNKECSACIQHVSAGKLSSGHIIDDVAGGIFTKQHKPVDFYRKTTKQRVGEGWGSRIWVLMTPYWAQMRFFHSLAVLEMYIDTILWYPRPPYAQQIIVRRVATLGKSQVLN